MKLNLEQILPDSDSSFRFLLTPKLNEVFYWHFHPEIELVYVEADKGIRHIGEHISTYEGCDLALIGSYIPHLNFDYGVKATVETVVIQFPETYFENGLVRIPELKKVVDLMERAKTGLAFTGETKRIAGVRLKKLQHLDRFHQFMELMSIFQFLAESDEYVDLDVRPISSQTILKQQERMHRIHQFVEANFQKPIDTQQIADEVNLSLPAFCRYFKKTTKFTYTDFVNQYRVQYAKKILIQDKNVTETCFESGFESLSYFNRIFKKWTGESPSSFRKQRLK
ncbi:AraC family transcriptional regulator [Aquirufa lenticrescens]|uniref:AraC family transcriptional regulator n=1 Tax=Aquirufa lenticrescens TaxID=2696560 RepID=UPI001CAA46EF|nr:AraC family transcriptional regulator [Aquirufa lenticrescens]UAJ13544.1 helix-turn-helix transcriptional regulator [Aquirufa lenticrescens]